MSIFAFCVFLPREFERNRTLSKKTIYRLRKFLGWCIIKLKIRLRIFLYTPVLCLWSSDDRYYDEQFNKGKKVIFLRNPSRPAFHGLNNTPHIWLLPSIFLQIPKLHECYLLQSSRAFLLHYTTENDILK